MQAWPAKGPDEVVDYVLNWGEAEGWTAGDMIQTSVWSIASGGAGLTIASNTFAATTTTVWLSGGTAGSIYKLRNLIETAGGRTLEEAVELEIIAK